MKGKKKKIGRGNVPRKGKEKKKKEKKKEEKNWQRQRAQERKKKMAEATCLGKEKKKKICRDNVQVHMGIFIN